LQFGFCTEHSNREYTVRKYLKSENLYTVKYCSSVFVLLNTVKDILNKDLSTPLIYICSTVYKMAKILRQKYVLQSFFHITFIYCKKSNDRLQYTVKRSNLFCSEYSPPATSVGQCVDSVKIVQLAVNIVIIQESEFSRICY